ncbi:MAG: protein phosphatase 2C domain-containing protein [Phycisphaeraceae bacterium]|nr:MAG: protein phosphatase 2C domain-containing protein [Phycisphaeraceae bacterium]
MKPQQLDPAGLICTTCDDDHAEVFACAGGAAAIYSRRAPGKETVNEDAALLLPLADNAALLAIADGCGGMPAGDQAALRTLEALATTVRESGDDPQAGVLAGFDAANRAVLDMRVGAGSTLTAVLIDGPRARVFYAGDSPALVTGQRGAIRFIASPHSPTGFGVEAGLMTEHEAIGHDERSLVLNIIGTPEMFVQVSPPVDLKPRDTVLLASDGLSDNLLTDRIVDLARVGRCDRAVEALAGATRRRMETHAEGHPDDLTIMLYRPLARRSR